MRPYYVSSSFKFLDDCFYWKQQKRTLNEQKATFMKKQSSDKGDKKGWSTFQKGTFLFHTSASFTPPLQKLFLLRLSKIATKVAYGADLLLL